jgi:hypothetical protein
VIEKDEKIWFPAKRYGWGWGLPVAWQGWLVVCGYLSLLIVGSVTLLPQAFAAYATFVVIVSAAFVWLCWLKGERARWRWRKD